jgi:glycosyltransferase involved in cell wall biosynthesis
MHIVCLTRITLGHAVKGGMEVHVATLARGLAARGHRVTIVTTSRPDGVTDETADGVRTLYLPGTNPGRYSHAWGRAIPSALERLHRQDPIDVVWGEGAGAYYFLGSRPRPLRVPVVTFLQGTYLGEMGTAWRVARARRGWRRACRFAAWRTIQYFRWDLRYTHGADHVIGASRQNAALARWGYWLPRAKVTASINGVDVDRFAPDPGAGRRLRERVGVPADLPLLLFCGRLEPEKGPEIAVRALARLRAPSVLLVAGTGSERADLEAIATSLGVSGSVRFVGHIANDDLPAWYNAATVFLYPTLAVESFGIAVAEAMACGRPVVASRLGGVRTSVDDPDTGFLVPPGDVAALAGAVDRLLRDPWEAERIGAAARKKALQALSAARMIDDVLAVFVRVTAPR